MSKIISVIGSATYTVIIQCFEPTGQDVNFGYVIIRRKEKQAGTKESS